MKTPEIYTRQFIRPIAVIPPAVRMALLIVDKAGPEFFSFPVVAVRQLEVFEVSNFAEGKDIRFPLNESNWDAWAECGWEVNVHHQSCDCLILGTEGIIHSSSRRDGWLDDFPEDHYWENVIHCCWPESEDAERFAKIASDVVAGYASIRSQKQTA